MSIAPMRRRIVEIIFLERLCSLNSFPPINTARKTEILFRESANATGASLTE